MEIVVTVIMLLVIFSMILKMTYLPVAGRLAIGLLCALFIVFDLDLAASQSKTRIDDWLGNPELMLDIAVLLTIDVGMQIAFCIFEARSIAGEKLSKTGNIIRQVTMWVPGILIFPTLFALLTEVIFSFPGIDFDTIALSLAAGVAILMLTFSYLVKLALPENDLRLELIFMVNAMIGLLGVIATVNGRTAVNGEDNVEWQALLGVILLLMAGVLAGLLRFKHQSRRCGHTHFGK